MSVHQFLLLVLGLLTLILLVAIVLSNRARAHLTLFWVAASVICGADVLLYSSGQHSQLLLTLAIVVLGLIALTAVGRVVISLRKRHL